MFLALKKSDSDAPPRTAATWSPEEFGRLARYKNNASPYVAEKTVRDHRGRRRVYL